MRQSEFHCDAPNCGKKIVGEYFRLKLSGRGFDDWFELCGECFGKLRKDFPAKRRFVRSELSPIELP